MFIYCLVTISYQLCLLILQLLQEHNTSNLSDKGIIANYLNVRESQDLFRMIVCLLHYTLFFVLPSYNRLWAANHDLLISNACA